MDEKIKGSSDQAQAPKQPSKRKLIKGLAVSAPVLISLAHRPAFGQICTLSGFGSIQAGTHLSHHPNYETTPCNTYSHGGWKTVLSGDPDWIIVSPITPFTKFSYVFGPKPPKIKTKKAVSWGDNITDAEFTELAQAFLGGATYTPDDNDPILLEVLTNGQVLSREICNAFLNATFAAKQGIPYFSVVQIIDLWNTGQATTASGELIPPSPMSDNDLVDLLKETYH